MMMKTVLLLLLLSSLQAFSQSVANYTTARSTGVAYSSISATGNAVSSWRNSGGGFQQDDNRSNFVNIGFDFWYNGTRYTQLSVSTNGFIDFSSSTDNGDATNDDFGYVNSAFSSSNLTLSTNPACAVLYDDLTAQGGTLPLGNSIRYRLVGSAPNRTLTIEWINMAVYGNTTPSLNFQVKLYENTGRIEYNYGVMNTGTFAFTYTLGINAATISGTPTAAQLKNQTSANSNTFSNTPQNNLVTLPVANSRITFTPPVPANPAGALTFTAVTQTSMTLNFPNWAVNEVGYVIYYSTDGVNYTFRQQTATNATSANVTGLSPGTTYFWRVHAVSEGALSTAMSGTQATNAAGNKVSNTATGNWNNPASWLPVGIPTATDNVTIRNGHTITVNTDVNCNDLVVGQGTSGILRIGNNGTARDLNINGNISVLAGANFSVNTASNTTHNLNLQGNIVNNGILNFMPDANSECEVTCIKNGNQSISGTGATNNYYRFNLNMGLTDANVMNVTSTNFTAPADFINYQNGTFRLASSNAVTLNLFSAGSSIMSPSCGFIMANPNATVTVSGDLELQGSLRVESGTFQVGSAANDILLSNGGELTINGGVLNITGRYVSSSVNNISRFQMSGGTMTVPTIGSTGSTTQAPFDVSSPGSVFIMSGGSIVIPREGGTGAQNLGYVVKNVINSSVTGGTLQIGSAATPATQIMNIDTELPVGNLLVNNTNATAFLVQPLTVVQNVTITTGTFNVNNQNVSVGGNWVDNANFVPGTATVTFNGNDLQTINDINGETFNNITFASTDTVRLLANINVTSNLLVNAGSTLDAGPANRTINIQRDWTKNGNFYARQGLVNFNGTVAQLMAGTGTTRFFDLRVGNTAGVSISSGAYEIEDAYTPASGNFNVSAATSFTLLSTATRTSRIAQAGAGTSVTGSMIVQRFISSRAAGYSDLSSPVTSTVFTDWDNELLLVYGYSPPFVYPSAYSYSESISDYVAVTTAAQAVTSGQGYEVYLDSDGTYTSFNNTTLDSRGNPRIGNVNVSAALSFASDGWNLIGNPYASFISLDNLLASSTGIAPDIMIYDEVAADFAVFSQGTGVQIAPHQGFWVQVASGTHSLTFTEAHKTTTTNSTFRNSNTYFDLSLQYAEKENFFTSHTQLVSENVADVREISFKHVAHPLAPRLYSLNETDQKFRIKKVDSNKDELLVNLGFKVGEGNVYSISAQNLQNMNDLGYTCVYLRDKLTGHQVLLEEGGQPYRFYASPTDPENRFDLVMYKNGTCAPSLYAQSGLVDFRNEQNKVVANIQTTSPGQTGTVQVFNLYGQPVSQIIPVNGNGAYQVQMPEVPACYLVKVTLGSETFVHKYVVQ